MKLWDQTKQRAKGSSSQAQSVNQQISNMSSKIYKAEAEMLKQGESFEVEDILIQVQGKANTGCRTLMQLYQHRYKQMKKLEGIDFKTSTLIKYTQMRNAVLDFIRHAYGTDDVLLSKVNIIFLQNLEAYLKTERGNKAVTANKVIQKLKSVVQIAIDNGWISTNPFPGHRFKHERIEVVYLTVEELERLEHYEFAQLRLRRVRDIFLFSVYTGLHYTDAMSLTATNIQIGMNGKEWIKYLRAKTNKWIYIPLLSKAKNLLMKFDEERDQSHQTSTHLVPRISNQKVNSYLKEISAVCNINKPLMHKVARKTFGSILLYYDVPMKVVSELMGHSSVTITEKHYAQVELKKLGEEMSGVDATLNLLDICT